MRSRVTSNCLPTSSSVWSWFRSMPKRMRSTLDSRGDRVASTSRTASAIAFCMAESSGSSCDGSSRRSPMRRSSSSPTGVSSEIGSREMCCTCHTLLSGISRCSASSAGVASRPFSCMIARDTRLNLLIVSVMCTGTRMVRDWSAMERVIAWRIHQVA